MLLKSLATIGGVATLVATSALANVKPADALGPSGVLNFSGDVLFTPNSFTFSNTNSASATSTGDFLPGTPVTVASITANATAVTPFVTADGFTFDLENFSQSNILFGSSPNGQGTAIVATNGTWFGPGGTSLGAGTFTAQVATGQRSGSTTYSASITATPTNVPEPSETLGILTLGAVGGMFVLRNLKRQLVNS